MIVEDDSSGDVIGRHSIVLFGKTETQPAMDDLQSAFELKGLETEWNMIKSNKDWMQFLLSAFRLCPHLLRCACVRPGFLARITPENAMRLADETIDHCKMSGLIETTEAGLMRSLRIGKTEISLLCGLADLAGWWGVNKVTSTLAKFADATLHGCLDFQLLALHQADKIKLVDVERPQKECGLVVLGMGKHGAFELNYSSDIDLVIFFDSQAGIKLETDDPSTLWARFARQLIKIMQERTADGYVFRTDLRLRPDPSSTPLVIPVEAALNYYEAHGQNWERAAFIKARPVAGDIHSGELFLRELAPFIWRRHLDFAAIQDVHSIKRQIHAHKGHGEIAIAGHNIKLGRGGIREIEFFAQTQQLIAGGRMPQLRKTKTSEALDALVEFGWVQENASEELKKSYEYLRRVEHRLQMVGDEQTHTLPQDKAELKRISRLMGCHSEGEFSKQLETILRQVESHYIALFETAPELSSTGGNLVFTGEDDDPGTVETLVKMGFERPSDIIRAIRGWHFGRYSAMQTSQARELLTELTPSLLEQLGATGSADEAFFGFDRFLAGLPAGIQLFSLLKTNAGLMKLLIRILAAAPRLADVITRKPHVFDGLLDPQLAEGVPQREYLEEHLRGLLGRTSQYEQALDTARVFALEQKFYIGIQLFNGIIDADEAGFAYSQLAEVMIVAMLDLVSNEFVERHGVIEGGKICVLGMGRLGSNELTAGSDLDLIFLYDHPADDEPSTGPKQLYASQYFLRFIQRLISAMSAPTAEGVIYELDFRLRPSGNSGPLATHINSFLKYQREEAWTWEAQALTRARPIAGDPEFAKYTNQELQKVLSIWSSKDTVDKDILDMRKRIAGQKGSKNPWAVKEVDGGLVDIEFLVQWAALKGGTVQGLENRGTKFLIENTDPEFIPKAAKSKLLEALSAYTFVMQLTRLCLQEAFTATSAPVGLQMVINDHFGQPSLSISEAILKEHQAAVGEIFKQVLKRK